MKTHHSTHQISCDILVAGGGPAGVACALAAARAGSRVVLCQDRPVLGGNASSEIRMHIVGANHYRRPSKDLALDTRETGIIEEIRLENAWRNPQRSPSMFDLILYEKCLAEPNLTLLLNTSVTDAERTGERITGALARRASTEEVFRLSFDIAIDCTGDGGLGVAAGAPFMRGREEKAAYGESLAQEQADSKTLGSTLLFMARKHDRKMPFVPPPWARKFTEDDLRLRSHARPGKESGLGYGYWWAEWGGQLDTVKDNETIRHELLAIVLGIWDHIKNSGDHGADEWALDWFGAVPGKRESRRFLGQYVLKEDDLMESRPFADAIAYGGWPIDLHPPEGVDRPDEPPCTAHMVPWLYDIPLRSCVSKEISNLMFAGRNISATHVAFASTRVMATCAAMGEGVGIAAAYAIQHRMEPAQLASNPEAMAAIQQRLLREDAWLIGRRNCHTGNIALEAEISASSEAVGGCAGQVLSGVTRAVTGVGGVPPAREIPGTHRWVSTELPAWLELRWETPRSLASIELVFDTGLHRHLTLTQSEVYAQEMAWGTGQPECIREYEILTLRNGEWTALFHEKDNYQRRRLHTFAAPLEGVTAIRLVARSAWQCNEARLVHLAVYAADAEAC